MLKLATPWMERIDPGVEVPMPTLPELVVFKRMFPLAPG